MNEEDQLNEGHPLFRELRSEHFWHCTTATIYRQILADGFVKPNDGSIRKFKEGACEALGGVALFDFHTEPMERVLSEKLNWSGFLNCGGAATVAIGFLAVDLPGKLTRYPDNLNSTGKMAIPWVEVCHQGSIPLSAATRFLVICRAHFLHFIAGDSLSEQRLGLVEAEFSKVIRDWNSGQEPLRERIQNLNAQLKASRATKK